LNKGYCKFNEQARTKLNECKAKQIEERDWEDVLRYNITIDGCNSIEKFIEKYPAGSHIEEAKEKMEKESMVEAKLKPLLNWKSKVSGNKLDISSYEGYGGVIGLKNSTHLNIDQNLLELPEEIKYLSHIKSINMLWDP